MASRRVSIYSRRGRGRCPPGTRHRCGHGRPCGTVHPQHRRSKDNPTSAPLPSGPGTARPAVFGWWRRSSCWGRHAGRKPKGYAPTHGPCPGRRPRYGSSGLHTAWPCRTRFRGLWGYRPAEHRPHGHTLPGCRYQQTHGSPLPPRCARHQWYSGYSQSEPAYHCGPRQWCAPTPGGKRHPPARAARLRPCTAANPPGWRHRRQLHTGLHPWAALQPAGCRGGRPPPRYTRPAAAGCTMLCPRPRWGRLRLRF